VRRPSASCAMSSKTRAVTAWGRVAFWGEGDGRGYGVRSSRSLSASAGTVLDPKNASSIWMFSTTACLTAAARSCVRAKDAELAETQRVLSVWIARQIEIDRVLLTSKTAAEFRTRTEKVARKIAPLAHRLQELAPDVQAKYPNVKDWSFLPNA
jgi:hypothetical protein